MSMKCPICKEQNIESRGYINEKDARAHLKSMHLKHELANLCAKILWQCQSQSQEAGGAA